MHHAIIQLSAHTSIYRGFSITKLPRKKMNPVTRYRVSQGDQSYGKFDAQAEATHYIDNLYRQLSNKKPTWFLVAIEGPTTDGRFVEADWLKQAAANYNPENYRVRVAQDAMNFIPDFISEVVDLAWRLKDGKVALFAKFAETALLRDMTYEANKNQQPLYPAIELMPLEDDFRLVGVHLTRQPVIPCVDPLNFV
ncbi:GPO family capsid scaffolding protein [Serratia marcescens]|nr:GPO family capsid scaffolding protein [Serratia ureilytica]MBN3901722.1 GPO family capsid scaffolding protein [Serratia marcescens]MBN3914351.1 GPO family capsid scaffolding protein [Serratia marcescens]MBN3917946.1 GPO family capsid scaffolding protein [Serratia marcescens]MBN3933866.1 GPO family capsid scaffolding protein [Serratia marcescens]